MLTTTPYLRIRRPSPTAVEFTVSTLPPLTLALRLSLYAIYLVQGLLSLLILLLLYATWARSPYGSLPNPSPSSPSPPSPSSSPSQNPPPSLAAYLQHLLHALLGSPPVRPAARLAQHLSPRVLVPACLFALYALAQRPYVEESLLVLRGLGIQTRSTKGNVLRGRAATRFIPTEKIRDVLVNEAFRGFEVRCYLVVVVEGEPDVVVVFPRLLPRAPIVERVWRGVRECLYLRKGGDGVGLGDGDGTPGGLYGRD